MDEINFNKQLFGRGLANPTIPTQSKNEASPSLPRSVSHGRDQKKRPKFERRRATSEDPGARSKQLLKQNSGGPGECSN